MKIGVVGLGAVGGLLAARLAAAGHDVSALTRGATLAAVRANGLRVQQHDGLLRAAVTVSDDPHALGPQELVIVALKAQALEGAAPLVQALRAPGGVVLPTMNGVPWWFLQAHTPADAQPLRSVDPQGRIAAALPLEAVLGGVVHFASSCPEPGVVRHGFGQRLIVGEPCGGPSPRTDAVVAALTAAGFETEASGDIRREIWFKLWGNMTMNPVSALTGATADAILDDPDVAAFMLRTMGEAAEVGARIGCPIAQSGEARMAVTRQLGAFKTSMLQDAEAGRTLELDALVTAVQEIGRRVAVPTPHIDALLGLTRVMARRRGLYPR